VQPSERLAFAADAFEYSLAQRYLLVQGGWDGAFGLFDDLVRAAPSRHDTGWATRATHHRRAVRAVGVRRVRKHVDPDKCDESDAAGHSHGAFRLCARIARRPVLLHFRRCATERGHLCAMGNAADAIMTCRVHDRARRPGLYGVGYVAC
jgi:hypothetical protein